MTKDKECELLPCPFCGGSAKIRTVMSDYGDENVCVQCQSNSRGVFSPPYHIESKDTAIEHWNTRAALDNLDDLVEKLEGYKAALHLAAHDVVFISEEDSSCFVSPCTWTVKSGKLLKFYGNANDTFGYSCADAEEMSLDDCVGVFKDACERFPAHPWVAVALWIQKKRNGAEFIPEVKAMVDEALAKHRQKGL